MKKFLTILSIFVSVILGSVVLVSCSKGYDKMYLTIEYLEYDGNNEVWKEIEAGKSVDYYLSSDVYNDGDDAYLLYLRVNVKGTSKKVNSLFISMSANNSARLESDTVSPGEAFKVMVKNVGSISFTAVPSDGGSDKSVDFDVNVYRKLEGVEQNKDCVPAVVVGGDITFGTGNLTGLIKYAPFDMTGKSTTNQTGVDYTIEAVGSLVDAGEDFLIDRRFVSAGYTVEENVVKKDGKSLVYFAKDDADRLMLRVSREYQLISTNNVIKLKATSVYDEGKFCDVYVYIVENYKDKFLVSYNNNVQISADGVIDDDNKVVGDEITIYDAILSSPYRSASIYAYVSSSIYSFISEPGMRLKVYVDGELYDYQNNVDSNLGIKISPATCENEVAYGLGIKFETTGRDERNKTEYNIKLELDFTAFDFTGSDTSPMAVLTKELTLKVGNLASGFNIKVNNGVAKTYADNIDGKVENLGNLYSYYSGLGMPIQIQGTPTSGAFVVKVAFYEDYSIQNGKINGTPVNYVQLLRYQNVGVSQQDGWFILNNSNTVYLNFAEDANLSSISKLYMVCSAVCTPETFQGVPVQEQRINFISQFDLIGAVKDMHIYKQADDRGDGTLTDELLQATAINEAYIGISAGAGKVDVDLTDVKVKQYSSTAKDVNKIQFSSDGLKWVNEISLAELTKTGNNYKLYFKASADAQCGFTVIAPNGVEKSVEFNFVNVVSSADKVEISFPTTYIWQSETTQAVKLYNKNAKINFLALQSNTSVKFEAKGDNKNANIKGISAVSLTENTKEYNEIKAGDTSYYNQAVQNFSSRAVVIANQSSYFFDVRANSSGFTAIVLVKVDFYIKDSNNEIEEDCKYFIYEIAVYNPASRIIVEADKDSIMYINDNFKDVAKVTFSVSTNSATQMIYFSSSDVNDEICIEIDGRNRISAVEVSVSETADSEHFSVRGLASAEANGATRKFIGISSNQFIIEATQNLGELKYIYVDFTIYQFATPTTYSLRKMIYLTTHTPSESIVVDGVDIYNNIYLSLQSDEQKTATITATVSNEDATYKELGYKLYTLDTVTHKTTEYTGSDVLIETLSNNRFKITTANAGGTYAGGTYQLTLYAKDSYDTEQGVYTTAFDIVINVSAGTKENPYLVSSLNDFEMIANNLSAHYRLANDINLSNLSNDWWRVERVFNGTIDGAMSIYDAENGNIIPRQFVLSELKISSVKEMTGNYNASLFSSLTNTAEIRNITLDRVKFELELNNANTGDTLNISALVGENNGVITNCCVNIISSNITVGESAGRGVYNIGVLVGTNNGAISYYNSQTATDYSAMVDCASGGILNVVVERNDSPTAVGTINIGGIAGTNTSNIVATYEDGSSQAIKHLLTGVVNINFVAGNNKNEQPEDINANIGGAVGSNSGTIENVAISGLIRANDKVNVGGIAGNNANEITECANYGMVLEGYALSTYKPTGNLVYTEVNKETNDYLLEQNIGGIVGVNSGNVDNVRTIFITFDNNEVSISAKESYISGVGNVSGVIAKANNTTLTRAYVENFIESEDVYNIIGNSVTTGEDENVATVYANVAGFIATGTDNKATIGFIKANISAKGCTIYEFGNGLTLNYVYFIGNILLEDGQLIGEANHGNVDNAYIVETLISFKDDVKFSAIGKYGALANDYDWGESTETEYTQISTTEYWAKWVKDYDTAEAGLINGGYPYLVYKIGESGTAINTLTIRATEVIVNVDEDYFNNGTHTKQERFEKYDQGLYIQYNKGESSTAVVYLYQNADNIHKLVTTETAKGLIEKTILPRTSSGAYSVRIISGADVAELISGDSSIRFKKTGRVVLQFTSLTNSKVADVVEIFVENALNNDDIFTLSTDKSKLNKVSGNIYSARANEHSIINLGLNSVRNNTFDSTKVYMKAQITDIDGYTADDDGYLVDASGEYVLDNGNKIRYADYVAGNEYLTLIANTIEQGNGYALGGYEFTTKELPQDIEKITVKIKFGVYLDLSAFSLNSGKKLSELYTIGEEALLEEKEITITIYNRATAIRMSSDVTVSAGVSANMQTALITGYRDANDSTDWTFVSGVECSGSRLLTNISGKDSIEYNLEAQNENANNLVEYAREKVAEYNATQPQSNQKEFTIWELFNITVGYKLTNDGYLYQINLTLKDEYRTLNKTSEDSKWIFKLTASASSNINVNGTANIEFVPQQLDTFRLENYAKLAVSVGSDNSSVEAEFTSSETASSLIIPGASGLVKVYAEKDYAYCENIQISSDIVEIDGEQYFVRFQQMTYNRTRGVYESYAGITTDGTSLRLVKVSYIENGVQEYAGVIFVRTILERMVGVRQVFTITVTATTYDVDSKPIDVSTSLSLISQYQPGVYVSVENVLKTEKDDTDVYLVEQGTSNVKIVAKVYGYQFNTKPVYSYVWLDDEETANIDDYIKISESNIEEDDDVCYITYLLTVYAGCKPFSLTFNMTLTEDGNDLTSNTEKLIFYPVRYLIYSADIKGVANGNMEITIGSSRELEVDWKHNEAGNTAINEDVATALGDNFLKLFYINKIDTDGSTIKKYFTDFVGKTTGQTFQIYEENGVYRIFALSKDNITVYFDIYYGYVFENDEFIVKFSSTSQTGIDTRIHCEFKMLLTVVTTEDMPRGIYTASDLRDMAEGENYILFNDITLEDWVPLTTEIASLDGNGNVITIKSFDITVATSVNAGLFAQVSSNTILKNVVINISGYDYDSIAINNGNVASSTINFGFLAGVNNGLIYNCEVISLGKAKTLEIVVGTNYTLTFGGLVGTNNGNITNSRVGTEYFVDVETSNTGATSSRKKSCGEIKIKSSGLLAGFVGENTATISSSYVANTSVENTQNKGDTEYNKTAGFVATNSGTIAYSYAKGLESSILITRSRATGSKLYASGSGSVAGFVFENKGEIHDCYSNIICESNSAVASGFVYDTTGGQVCQCYSASTVLSGNTDTALATELPFAGIGLDKTGAQELLTNDKDNMANCYYLNDGQDFDTNYIVGTDKYEPIALSLEDFANPDYLSNFAFVRSGSSAQQLNGVWTYSTSVDKNKSTYSLGVTSLPELSSANKIAKSIRYEPSNEVVDIDELHDYPYAYNYERGGENNPYIIRSADEYLKVFAGNDGSATSKYGYIRLIDDVSFVKNGNSINIPTRTNYVLGDKNQNNITILDGNGMSLSGVVVNQTDDDVSIGLFSEVYYAVIKGVNIEFANLSADEGGVGTSTAITAGGFAGKAENVFFIDIDLSGGAEVRAKNVAGGLVGILTGSMSGVYNVSSDLDAKAGAKTSKTYTNVNNLSDLSYAGGLAGIVDIGSNNEYININKIEINSANIEANRAGGIAGYLGKNVYANRLTYETDTTAQIFGLEVVGGLIGENYAKISLSQIGASLDTQHEYDKAFGAYINNGQTDDAIEGAEYGNLSAVQGAGIVGGFIGINNNGKINDSLTKANIGGKGMYGSPNIVGGFIGEMKGGELKNCYAQNSIDLAEDNEAVYVGGLFGQITGTKLISIDNVVVATWFDKTQIKSRVDAGKNVDYIVANGSLSEDDCMMSYGDYLTAMGVEIEASLKGAEKYDMQALYNLDASTQKEIFESLFILWDTNYWDLDNTKFMPNLKPDNATSFIELIDRDDLKKLSLYPNANFILMNDIEVGEVNANYVANVDFSGILVGKMKEDGTYPKFNNITLKANTNRSVTSGFFKSTNKARIANVGFEYEELTLSNNEFTSVGGVSAEDVESRFENVTVDGAIKSAGACAVSVGSVVGDSKRSTIIGCLSSVVLEIKFNNKANIGGIIGSLDGTAIGEEAEVNTFDGLIRNTQYSGSIEINSEKDGKANVGGIAGYAVYTTISGNTVGNNAVKTAISASGEQAWAVVGGIVGSVKQITVVKSGTYVKVTGSGIKTFETGGIVGETQTSGVNIEQCYTKLDANIEEQKSVASSMARVGGIVARASAVEVDQVATEIREVYAEINAGAEDDGKDATEYVTLGGIVASAGAIKIEKAVAYLNPCGIEFNTRLIGGGFIGQAMGNYTISDSTSMGRLLANSTQTENPTIVILGGMVGLVGTITDGVIEPSNEVEGSISTSVTAVTLSTAGIYQGSVVDEKDATKAVSHKVIVNALVGQAGTKIITTRNVVYSSDYCLVFDNAENKFTQMPSNYSADILLDVEVYDKVDDLKAFNNVSWITGHGFLPVPAITDILVKAGVLDYENENYQYAEDYEGSCLSPIEIPTEGYKDRFADHKDVYTYYLLNSSNVVIGETIAKLNGVILGCNNTITGNTTLVKEITKHSAISNLIYNLKSGVSISSAGFVSENNNGTIFMCGLDYSNATTSGFGGFAGINNGVVSYCYNAGEASSATGKSGGIVSENGKYGAITYSYFIGTFNTQDLSMSAIAYTNAGYIGYCYSAGSAGSPIASEDNEGRYEQNYFDYYANFVTKEDYNNTIKKMAEGKSTADLQATGTIGSTPMEEGKLGNNYYSTLWTNGAKVNYNWLVFGINNVTFDRSAGIYENTYNYGYPIHNFNQKVLINGDITDIPLRAKLTGDGTYFEVDQKTDVEGKVVKGSADGEYYDDNSYLLPHFGLLMLVSQMEDTSNRYFELEFDLTMPSDMDKEEYYFGKSGQISNWTGIGGSGTPFRGVFSSIRALAEGESEYGLDTDCTSAEDENSVFADVKITKVASRKINYLTGEALFHMVDEGAVIANLELNNSVVKTAPLVNYVGNINKTADESAQILIYKISIEGKVTSCEGGNMVAGFVNTVSYGYKLLAEQINLNASIVADSNGASTMSGLINTNEGRVEMIKFQSSEIKFDYQGLSSVTVAGIVGRNQSRTEGITASITIQGNGTSGLSVSLTNNKSSEIESFSGIAYINSGDILAEEFAITIGSVEEKCGILAGAVSIMKGGNIGGFNLNFEAESEDCKAEIFGGVVGRLLGGSIGIAENDEDVEGRSILVELKGAKAKTYGGVVGEVVNSGDAEAGDVARSINNVTISAVSGMVVEVEPIEITDVGAYGLIIGQMHTTVTNINYKLEESIGFEVKNGVNVGGIIGLSSVGRFNFTNEAQKMGTIKGVENVGGFIGHYTGDTSLIFTGTTWVVEATASYATVSVYGAENAGDEQNRSYFGGLIGYWQSASPLKATAVNAGEDAEASTGDLIIKNYNDVLTKADDLKNFKYTATYPKYISYVGGVVGFSMSSIIKAENYAKIGVEIADVDTNENNGYSPFTGDTLDDIANLMYVGGVVGSLTPTSGVLSPQIIECASTGSVYGRYSVGGVIGYAENIAEITGKTGETGDDKSASSGDDSIVLGLINVGGIAGIINNSSQKPMSNFEVNSKVIGVINVGGLAGSAINVRVKTISVNSKSIKGNANVGGLVGDMYSGTIGVDVIIKDDEDDGKTPNKDPFEGVEPYADEGEEVLDTAEDNKVIIGSESKQELDEITTIYGVVHSITHQQEKEGEYRDYYYLPVNVGGVVGRLNADDATVSMYNTKTYARVETDRQYKIVSGVYGGTTETKEGTLTVSMITNYTVDLDSLVQSLNMEDGVEDYYTTNGVKYNIMDTGIGGFVGTIDGKNFEFGTECYALGEVYAEYGVNVGGVAGNLLNVTTAMKLPSLSENPTKPSKVAGNLFVGGYIGKVNSMSGDLLEGMKFYVNVQQYRAKPTETAYGTNNGVASGNCIGGVIGYCVNGITDVSITSGHSIKIFNKADSSFGTSYVGCIVGRLDGNMTDCSVDASSCGAYNMTNGSYEACIRSKQDTSLEVQPEIIQSYDTFNYGGLVGMLNIAKNGAGENSPATVNGTHYYPFTVDTVQNRDYNQGTTIYGYDADTANEVVSAIAHYVNTSHIAIVASKLNSLYDDDEAITGDESVNMYSTNHNPTNENYLGWAKEYTMFRTLNRVIEQSIDTGDSVQSIYNAQYITAVKTDYDVVKVGEYYQTYSNEIVYTVYQPVGQTARLYCKYGIAEYSGDFDPNEKIKATIDPAEKYGYEKPSKGDFYAAGSFVFEYNYEVRLDSMEEFINEAVAYISGINGAGNGGGGTRIGYTTLVEICAKYNTEETVEDALKKYAEEFYAGCSYINAEFYECGKIFKDMNPNLISKYMWHTGETKDTLKEIGRTSFWKHIDDYGKLGAQDNDWYGIINNKDASDADRDDLRGDTYDIADKNADNYQYTYGYSYFNLENYKNSVGNNYFKFTIVFGLPTTDSDKSPYFVEDETLYSNSGSLFEVSGVPITIINEFDVNIPLKKTFWEKVLSAVTYTLAAAVAVLVLFVPGVREAAVVAFVAMVGAGVMGVLAISSWGDAIVYGTSQSVANAQYVEAEDVSLGYQGSIYARQIYWKDGELVAGQDGILAIEVDATTNGAEVKEAKDLSDDDKMDILYTLWGAGVDRETFEDNIDLDDAWNLSFKVIFPSGWDPIVNEIANNIEFRTTELYSFCQNSNIMPADLDVMVRVDTGTNGSATCQTLNKLSITEYLVPKYIKVDNEIYIHSGSGQGETANLYENYESNISILEADGLEKDIDFVNDGGYSYVADKNRDGVLSSEHDTYIKETYGISRTITRMQRYDIVNEAYKGADTAQKRAAKAGELTLVENEAGDIEKTLYIVGYYTDTKTQKEPSTYAQKYTIADVRAVTHHGTYGKYETTTGYTYYFTFGGSKFSIELKNGASNWYYDGITKVDSIPAAAQTTATKVYLYCSVEEPAEYNETANMKYSVEYSTRGIALETFGLSYQDYCYKYNKSGNIELPVTYYFYNRYGDKNLNNGGTVINPIEMNQDILINLYEFGKDGKWSGTDASKISMSLGEIANNWGTYQLWSTSKDSYTPASLTYMEQNEKLYAKEIVTAYIVDEHTENGAKEKYLVRYAEDNRSADGINYWNYNKFLYEHIGKGLKFYTRYKYEDAADTFFRTKVSDAMTPTEKYSLETLLLDQHSLVIFSESVRVSLSPQGTVYKKVTLNGSGKITVSGTTVDAGSITCLGFEKSTEETS